MREPHFHDQAHGYQCNFTFWVLCHSDILTKSDRCFLFLQAIKLIGSEGRDIVDAFKTKDHFSAFKKNGVLVEGINYQYRGQEQDGQVVLAKKRHYGIITLEASPRGNESIEHCLQG